MRAMIVKEFRQLKRDRRTLAMLVVLPVLLLVIFGYAARFDVSRIPTVVVGPQAALVASHLHAPFQVVEVDARGGKALAESRLRDGDAVVGVVDRTRRRRGHDGRDPALLRAGRASSSGPHGPDRRGQRRPPRRRSPCRSSTTRSSRPRGS